MSEHRKAGHPSESSVSDKASSAAATAADTQLELTGEAEQVAFGELLATLLEPGMLLFLEGELGAGKTTLARGIARGLGHSGAVKSPTYTLVEPYRELRIPLYHFDLYRLGDPEELEYLGIRDYFDGRALAVVEWPERGAGFLPPPDLRVELSVLNTHVADGAADGVADGAAKDIAEIPGSSRAVSLTALSPRGRAVIEQVIAHAGYEILCAYPVMS